MHSKAVLNKLMQPLLNLGPLVLPHVFSLKIAQFKNRAKFGSLDKLGQSAGICYKDLHGEELLDAP